MPVSDEAFRAALGRWASGVTIVTARAGDRVHGMTVSAFSSVSLDPPLVLICASKSSNTYEVIEEGRVFAANILAADQQDLSNKFASKKEEQRRFEGLDWKEGATGAPILPGALAALDCRVVAAHDAGDHVIYVGQVEAVVLDEGRPLIYYGAGYRALTERDGGGRLTVMADPVRLLVYSDYLCPWCYNAALRLERIQQEFGSRVEIVWHSYLLRPRPKAGRDLAKFTRYTESWQRPAQEEHAGTFQVWQGDEGPPSHSIPPQLVSKAAARHGEDAFARMHRSLLRAYFAESRNITSPATLEALWGEADLPSEAFPDPEDPSLLGEVLADHQQAVDLGMTGVPAARLEGNDAFVTGALPLESYRRWIQRQLLAEAV